MTAANTADEWADRYGELRLSGPGSPNAWLGIPLTIAALVGMLWSVPVPAALGLASPVLNFATLFLMATFVYYCVLSLSLALAGLVFLIAAAVPGAWLDQADLPVWAVSSAVFAPAFAWQLVETRRATGRLMIARNLQYLMLGPVWLLRGAYRTLGLAY